MKRKKIKVTAVCSLILFVLLCGCGAGGREVVTIGREEPESGADEYVSDEAASRAAIPDKDVPNTVSEIRVHVCGAVSSPGVVALPEGSRAEDALQAAGGFAEDAWRDYINLAEKVSDGQKLYFPTLEEAETMTAQDTGTGLVNINSADIAALSTLPGIGEAKARDIIAYREAHGAFENCEDIMKVPGIKTSVYSKISDMITVR